MRQVIITFWENQLFNNQLASHSENKNFSLVMTFCIYGLASSFCLLRILCFRPLMSCNLCLCISMCKQITYSYKSKCWHIYIWARRSINITLEKLTKPWCGWVTFLTQENKKLSLVSTKSYSCYLGQMETIILWIVSLVSGSTGNFTHCCLYVSRAGFLSCKSLHGKCNCRGYNFGNCLQREIGFLI